MSTATKVDAMTTKHDDKPQDRFAWSVNDWATAAGISRASVYNLMAAGKIESVTFGKKRLVTTHPKDFLDSLKSEAA